MDLFGAGHGSSIIGSPYAALRRRFALPSARAGFFACASLFSWNLKQVGQKTTSQSGHSSAWIAHSFAPQSLQRARTALRQAYPIASSTCLASTTSQAIGRVYAWLRAKSKGPSRWRETWADCENCCGSMPVYVRLFVFCGCSAGMGKFWSRPTKRRLYKQAALRK
jgi:hypothetical protein